MHPDSCGVCHDCKAPSDAMSMTDNYLLCIARPVGWVGQVNDSPHQPKVRVLVRCITGDVDSIGPLTEPGDSRGGGSASGGGP
jgi:hypothetical protein